MEWCLVLGCRCRDPLFGFKPLAHAFLPVFVLKSPEANLVGKPNCLRLYHSVTTRNCGARKETTVAAKILNFLLTRNGLGVGYVQSGKKWDTVVWTLALVGASCAKWFHRPKRLATRS